MEGTPFGRYRLIELIGRGGMGEVWRAFDTETQRVVAVKVLPANLASDPVFEQRFRREALAAAGLSDPHVVPIHHFGEIDGRLYVDMRLIEGQDLQTVLVEGPLEPSRAIGIIEQVASALHAAHRVGLVHRDVKPSNILVAEHDFAYLIDFGIARAAGQTQMTGTGNVIGTWAYLAPERVTCGQSDSRADTYALACVLHESLTGSQPFPGKSIEQQIGAHLGLPPPRPSALRADLPVELDTVIATGMAKNPDDRYATVTDLAVAARTAITARASRQRPEFGSSATYYSPPVIDSQVAAPRPTDSTVAAQPQRARIEFPGPPQPVPRRRGAAKVVAAIGAVAVLVVVVVTAIALRGGSDDATAPAASPGRATTAAIANSGPFTGVFSVEYGPPSSYLGAPFSDPTPKRRWAARSKCGPGGGCVATVARQATSNQPASALIFDDIGGRWIAVFSGPGKCADRDVERFTAITLQPRPDGTLSGDYRTQDSGGCTSKRSVTLTRTGDVAEADGVVDPSTVAPQIDSPAMGLRGRYHETMAFKSKSYQHDLTATTDCLRDATRCLAVFFSPETVFALVFSNGKFSQDSRYPKECSKGGTSTVRNTADFPLPSPPQDPIAQLSAHGHQETSGSACATSNDYEDTYVRTGD